MYLSEATVECIFFNLTEQLPLESRQLFRRCVQRWLPDVQNAKAVCFAQRLDQVHVGRVRIRYIPRQLG